MICKCPACDPEVFKHWFGRSPGRLPNRRRRRTRGEIALDFRKKLEQRKQVICTQKAVK